MPETQNVNKSIVCIVCLNIVAIAIEALILIKISRPINLKVKIVKNKDAILQNS